MKKAAKPPADAPPALSPDDQRDLEKLARVGCVALNQDVPLEQVFRNTQRALELIQKLKPQTEN